MQGKSCFFCTSQKDTLNYYCKMYKAVQTKYSSKMKIDYETFSFPIPICNKCHDKAEQNFRIERIIFLCSLLIGIGIASIIHLGEPESNYVISSIVIALIATGIAFLILRIITAIVMVLLNRHIEIKSYSHPIAVELKEHEWVDRTPHPKYGPFPERILKIEACEESVEKRRLEYKNEANKIYKQYY